MIITITVWVLSMISFGFGYFIGSGKKPRETIEEVKQALRRSTIKAGPVMRPTAEKVNLWANPRQEEEDDAFKESFRKDTGLPL
jgi:hypothetical protein